MVTMLLKPF